jgi:hypothetical protein
LRRERPNAPARASNNNKEDRDEDEKDIDTTEGGSAPPGEVINAEMLLFGSTLGKHHLANIEVQ